MRNRTKADRRESPRYALKSDFFLAFWPYLDKVGKVKDISSGGAAFEYLVLHKDRKVVDAEVNIFSDGPSNLMLRRLPCKVVYDVKIREATPDGIETRRCGLKFGQLSEQHGVLLKVLLSNYVSQPLSGL